MAQNGIRRKKCRRGEDNNKQLPARKLEGKRRKCVANPRDCMAKAFQVHLQQIIENSIVCDSDLPDIMISNGSLTEDECCYIRERPNRKDQIRKLMVIIRGRSLKNMESLLNYFEQENACLAKDIHGCYKDLINQGYRDTECLRCKLKTDVDIKTMADRLHTVDVISRKLYNEIVMSEVSIGGQDRLWDKLITGVESTPHPEKAFNSVKSCLSEKGHYLHLADDIDKFLVDGRKMMECICNVKLRPQSACSSKYSNSDSTEPHSSESQVSSHSVELRSKVMETMGPRPEAMYFTPDCGINESVTELSVDVQMRQCKPRRNLCRPMAWYVLPQMKEKFLTEMVLEADPRITNVSPIETYFEDFMEDVKP